MNKFQKATRFALIMGGIYGLLFPLVVGNPTNVNIPGLFIMGVVAGYVLFYCWRAIIFMMGYSYIRSKIQNHNKK